MQRNNFSTGEQKGKKSSFSVPLKNYSFRIFSLSSFSLLLHYPLELRLYDYNPAQDAASGGDEDLISHGTYTYVTDWNPGYESGNIVITRDGNFYRIELNDLKFLKDANGDDGVDSFEPKASGSFVWEGELKDITSWMNGDEYGRSLSYGSPWNKLSRIAR